MGKDVEILLPERHCTAHMAHRAAGAAAARARPMGVDPELFGRRKDGSEFPVEVSSSPLETEEGMLLMSAIRDMTDRKRAQEALRQSEARLQAIMDHSPAMIFVKNIQGRYLHVNHQFRRRVERSPAECANGSIA